MPSVSPLPAPALAAAGPQDAPPGAAVRAHPAAVLALIAVGALAVICLWWYGTPAIHGFGDWLTNAGRVTGLLAGYGVVVLVALMARLPPLEHGIGADRLARWHAMGGRYTVGLVIAHALLIIWGYAVSAHTTVVSQTKTLLVSYPDVLAATAAGLLLAGVGISSARAARRRLRYETWYYLHFYTYLAVALAFSHQFATGAEFISSLPARIAWGRHVRGRGRRHRLVPVRHPGAPSGPPPAARGRGAAGGARRGEHRDHWPAPGRAAGGIRSFLPLAFPRPRPVVGSGPVLAVRGAPTGPAAHHREGPGRPQPRPGGAPAGYPGAGRGPLWCAHRRGQGPAQGPADRGGRRHHAAARAVRDASGRPRRHHPHLPGQRRPRRGLPPRA